MSIKHGMILAAGLGKRMQPLTLKTPKPLLEINNSTLLERAINLLISHGVQEININVHYLPDQIQKFINNKKFWISCKPDDPQNGRDGWVKSVEMQRSGRRSIVSFVV